MANSSDDVKVLNDLLGRLADTLAGLDARITQVEQDLGRLDKIVAALMVAVPAHGESLRLLAKHLGLRLEITIPETPASGGTLQ